jgi:hypothetical protein
LFQILEGPKYSSIEKIKTIGSTYMAASGLKEQDEPVSTDKLVIAIAEYAFAMKEQLDDVNENSWNNFKLRIGLFILSLCHYSFV